VSRGPGAGKLLNDNPSKSGDHRPVSSSDYLPGIVCGAFSAMQSFLNGRLALRLGSPGLAAAVNNVVALFLLGVAGAATGVPGRALATLRRDGLPARWKVVLSGMGAIYVIIAGTVAPRIGLSALTVSAVCGQTLASLVLDRVGIGPAGRRPLSAPRVAAAALTVAAVALDLFDAPGNLRPGLLLLGVVGGAAFATQQAGMGHLTHATGEPLAAAFIAITVASVFVFPFALITTGGATINGWSAPLIDWAGGIFGALIALIAARAVAVVGSLRLALAMVAGQAIGGLSIDVAFPVPGHPARYLSVVTILLALVAVAVGNGLVPWRGRPKLSTH
jgi:transporter family-2 protein